MPVSDIYYAVSNGTLSGVNFFYLRKILLKFAFLAQTAPAPHDLTIDVIPDVPFRSITLVLLTSNLIIAIMVPSGNQLLTFFEQFRIEMQEYAEDIPWFKKCIF